MSVLCIGQVVADVVVRPVHALPSAGRLAQVDDLRLVSGGCAANTAGVLARLGVDTALVGLVGRDPLADAVLAELAGQGVDITGVVRDSDVQTSAVVVLVDGDGERSFLYREGGNEQLTNDMVRDLLLSRAEYVHVGGAMKLTNLDLRAVLERARGAGCSTSLDTDWDATGRWLSALEQALPCVDYLMTNEDEGRMLTGISDPGEMGAKLLAHGPRAVIIKRGGLGATLVTATATESIPAFDVGVVDTTCAGDAFAGGFLFGLSRGWDSVSAVRFGNATGALCTTGFSHSGVGSLDTVMEFVGSQLGTDARAGMGLPIADRLHALVENQQ